MRYHIKRWDNNETILICNEGLLIHAMQDAIREGVSFAYADLSQCDLSIVSADFAGVDFSHARLHYSILWVADLTSCDFSNADLQYARFKGCKFDGADLRGANITNANFYDSDFRGANIDGLDFSVTRRTSTKRPLFDEEAI